LTFQAQKFATLGRLLFPREGRVNYEIRVNVKRYLPQVYVDYLYPGKHPDDVKGDQLAVALLQAHGTWDRLAEAVLDSRGQGLDISQLDIENKTSRSLIRASRVDEFYRSLLYLCYDRHSFARFFGNAPKDYLKATPNGVSSHNLALQLSKHPRLVLARKKLVLDEERTGACHSLYRGCPSFLLNFFNGGRFDMRASFKLEDATDASDEELFQRVLSQQQERARALLENARRLLGNADDGSELYTADNSVLKNPGNGVDYRGSKSRDNRVEGAFLKWGDTVRGTDDGNGWLQVDLNLFLPLAVNNIRILKPVGFRVAVEDTVRPLFNEGCLEGDGSSLQERLGALLQEGALEAHLKVDGSLPSNIDALDEKLESYPPLF